MSLPPSSALDAVGQLPDVEIDLAGTALQLARVDAPDADWRRAATRLSEMAKVAAGLAAQMPEASLRMRAGALAALMGRFGFAGDVATYDDLANANLIRVIERRRGLPVALGILWLHCASAAGWPARGLNFPGHFLVALEGPKRARGPGPGRVIVDVFAGGVVLSDTDLLGLLQRTEGTRAVLRPGVLAPMSSRGVLLRLQKNIVVRRLDDDDMAGVAACLADMVRIAPDSAGLWQELAGLHEGAGEWAAALRCYGRVVDLVPTGATADRARRAMDALRDRLG